MNRAMAEITTGLALLLALINPYAANPYCFGRWTPYALAAVAAGLWVGYLLNKLETVTFDGDGRE